MEYDYLVIGAGSAGCAVAARLAERGKEVALLEAGGPDDAPEIPVPAAFPALFKSALDWDYATEPQKGLNGRTDYWPRGKTLGGSSSINAMIYQRGAPSDFDAWAALGNAGWSWADVLPLYKRSENQERGPSEYHGVGGPMNVADLRDPNPLTRVMLEASASLGLPVNEDFNGATQVGVGMYQVNQKNGTRWSAANGYLHPWLEKGSGIEVVPNAHVTRLTFEGTRCTGAVFVRDGQEHTIRARREVILTAGAINSPQLLMLSGVGPREELESLGIPVLLDLPGVGQNLQDHMMVPVAYTSTKPITLAGAGSEEEGALFQNDRMGMLTSNIAEAGGFLALDPERPAPELQLYFAPSFFILHGAGNPEGHGFTLLPCLVGTRSVGRMWLRSADPLDKPALDPNYLGDPRDLEVLVEGIKLARRILAAPAFDEYRGAEHLPGEGVTSDEDIREHVRNYAQGVYHPVGTCKMGPDDMAVVDAELRVHGLQGLRVADASIMPFIVNANTNNPCIMIGEKCADLITEHAT